MNKSQTLTIRLHQNDNVVVARDTIAPGTEVEAVAAAQAIPAGHKIATQAIRSGEAVRKYDQIIGFASTDIAPGDHVHTHNLAMSQFARDHEIGVDAKGLEPAAEPASFQGYRRADGRVGTRNYIGIIPTVNCSASVARYIADRLAGDALTDFAHVDGVVALPHSLGCGMAATGDGWGNFQRVITGYANHPNFGGIVMVGLGCEVAQVAAMQDAAGKRADALFHAMTIQDSGGTRQTVEEGVARVRAMLPEVDTARRETVPASELVLGLECGGSDAYSGISANPSLGNAADRLVRHGGTAILGETPEIYGAEHLLTRRAVSQDVGHKLIDLITWWEDYTAKNQGEMNANPSPGNKAGGLTTILEKSLGAAAKGGTTDLVEVYRYAEPVTAKGFVFMDTPGYDPASITGMVAGGANIVCFTTGRGSVFGCKPVPSLKLATNTAMYRRMAEDMDINCGPVVDGETDIEAKGAEIFETILATASGAPSKSESLGIGDLEFLPWQIGAVM